MECDGGRLQAYLDGAMPADERIAVENHLAGCSECRDELAVARARCRTLVTQFGSLEPAQVPNAAAALKRFRGSLEPAEVSGDTTLKWRFDDMKRMFLGRWRPVAVGLMVLVMLVGVFSFAPVREAAADFLGIFRVRKFAVIPIDAAQLEKLEGVGQTLEGGVLGEPVFTREPGEVQPVADVSEASARGGFSVRTPAELPEGTVLNRISVAEGPAATWEVDQPTLQTVLDALETGVVLPDTEKVVAEVDVPTVVEQQYRVGSGTLTLWQVPSPTLTIRPDLDPTVLGEALLRFMGIPADEASRLAAAIDWSSTLVIPLPTDSASAQEVDVDGVTGLLLQVKRDSPSGGRQYALLWQRDGIVYGIQSTGVGQMDLMRAADSLQ
jgi:anti-sigma factor RsiW